MRRCFGVLVAVLALALVAGDEPPKSQKRAVTTLARDVVLDRTVVVLEIPPPLEGERLRIVVVAGKEYRLLLAWARAGTHAYDFRNSENWRGRAQFVIVDLPNVKGMVRTPTNSDEIDVFLEPEILQPKTVNYIEQGHRLFDLSWEGFLLILFVLGTVGFRAATRRRGLACLFGFCLAWAAMDARTMVDHFHIVRRHERNGRAMFGLEDATAFAKVAAPIIGAGSWTVDSSLNEYPLEKDYLVGYAFADRRYVPDHVDRNAADFVVTADPKQGTVVCSSGKLFLVRKGPR